MEALNMIFYTAITLGVLIFIHELGHFLAAKLTGMRVDRFSIGFPPRAFGKQIGDTDYCISWIPLGGYVKIAGMVDESFDTEFANLPPQPWEFRAKPMWAKMIVISAGVIMNLLLAIVIFWGIHYAQGAYLKESTTVGYVAEGSAAQKASVHTGDKILSINGKAIRHWDEIYNVIYLEKLGEDVTLQVERQGQPVTITIPRENLNDLKEEFLGIAPAPTAPMIRSVEPNKPADKLGLRSDDILVALADSPVAVDSQVIKIVKSHANKPLTVTWKRGEQIFTGTAVPDENGRLGIGIASSYTGPTTHIDYTLGQAFSESIKEIVQATTLFYTSFQQIVAGKTSMKESFGGPIKIAQFATQSAAIGISAFLRFMAMLSVSLAILNILPIPALDGGHLLLLLIETLIRREIPHKIRLAVQQAGFVLLLAFMAFVIYNDITSF
jgi:regulator of sigma E protease